MKPSTRSFLKGVGVAIIAAYLITKWQERKKAKAGA